MSALINSTLGMSGTAVAGITTARRHLGGTKAISADLARFRCKLFVLAQSSKWLISSDGVLEDRPWPRGSSRTKNHVLGLGLESPGLGLEGSSLVLGLGLDGPGLDYMQMIVILWKMHIAVFSERSFQLLVIHVGAIYSHTLTIL